MNTTSNDILFDLQFLNPEKYKNRQHNWEKDILSILGRTTEASVHLPTDDKPIISEREPISKYEHMKSSVPIHLKAALTIREAAAYTNIGINKIDALLRSPNCPFVLFVGTKKLVKRREFEQFISNRVMI